MKKPVFCLLFALTLCITTGCGTMPVSSSQEELGVGERGNVGVTESIEPEETEVPELTEDPEVTEEPEATATPTLPLTLTPTLTPTPTAAPRPTAISKPTSTVAPVIDRNVVERDAYAVNSKNGKIHKTGDCPATGDGKNAMTAPVYFPTYEEAEAYSIKIKRSLDKRKCGNCWR